MMLSDLTQQIDYSIFFKIARLRVIDVSIKTRLDMLRLCRSIVDPIKSPAPKARLSFPLQHAIVFVSLYQGDQLLACTYHQGNDFHDTIFLSAQKAIRIAGIQAADSPIIHFGISILLDAHPIPNESLLSIQENFLLGIHGISIQQNQQFALFKNSVPIDRGFDLPVLMKQLCKKAKLPESALHHPSTTLMRYSVIEFREDYLNPNDPHGLYDLFRASPILLQKEITQNSVQEAIQLCFDCLNHFFHADENILFYTYDLNRKKWLDEKSPQAIIRKIASVWIFTKLGHFLKKKAPLKKTDRFLSQILSQYILEKEGHACLVYEDKADLGTLGFLLCAMAERQKTSFYQNEIRKFSNFIYAAVCKKEKKMIPLFDSEMNPLHSDAIHESEFYFPFIALHGLYQIEKNHHPDHFIQFLDQTFSYYQRLSQPDEHKIKMLTWATQAYTHAYFQTKKVKYARLIFSLNDFILDKQLDERYAEPDLIGSFSRLGNARATAVITESLINAYRIACDLKDVKRKEKYKTAIFMAMRFIMQAQLKSDHCKEANIIGGFKNHFFDANIRIDNLQHCGNVLLEFYQTFFNELE